MSSSSRAFPKGLVITVIVALVAVSAIVVAFLQNASPYVTVAQAQQIQGDNLHLAGDILKETMKSDMTKGLITFDIRDEKGDVCTVVYKGMPPANMGEATKVVAIGGMKDGKFHSEKMLVKCPSKYEAEAKKA